MFIQIIKGKCSRPDELRAMTDRWVRDLAPAATGWLGGTFGFTEDGDSVAVVRFESRQAAEANAARSEQSAWYAEMESLFDGPLEFHDCDTVKLMLDGGSDDAGFVQVITGHIDDASLLESTGTMEAMLHEARPEIIGITFAMEADGTFVETVFFTDEAAARAGEAQTMPTQGQAAESMRQWQEHVHVAGFMDLRQPWFASSKA